MCITPLIIDEETTVSCRKCWSCRQNRVNDYIGRAMAEAEYCTATYSVTLTYRNQGNGANCVTLVYRDVQLFLKKLRLDFPGVRYICAGEYGGKKGRAHWHIVLFFTGEAPEVVTDPTQRTPKQIYLARHNEDDSARIIWPYWRHGFVFFQQPDYGGFEYALKYINKDQHDESADGKFALSKKPLLGWEYFVDLAERYVLAGISPNDVFYSVGDQYDTKGKRRKYQMRGVMRTRFIDLYLAKWYEAHDAPHPQSDYIREYLEKEDIRNTPDEIWTDDQWQRHFLFRQEIKPSDKFFRYTVDCEYSGGVRDDGRGFTLSEWHDFGQYRFEVTKQEDGKCLEEGTLLSAAQKWKNRATSHRLGVMWLYRKPCSDPPCNCPKCEDWRDAWRLCKQAAMAQRKRDWADYLASRPHKSA